MMGPQGRCASPASNAQRSPRWKAGETRIAALERSNAALTAALEELRKSIPPRRLRIIVPPRAKEGGPTTEVGARGGK